MARRRSAKSSDSLELLLDTMCNAFGGIVLIAILVAMLIQPPGEQGGNPGGLDRDYLDKVREKLKEWEELQPDVTEAVSDKEKMGDLVALILERDRLAALLEERQRMGNQSMTDLIKLLQELLKERDTTEKEASGLDKEIASEQEKLNDLMRQLAELEDQTKDLINKNKQELRPPRAESAPGNQALFMVRNDEVFPVQNFVFGPNGSLTSFSNNTQSIRWEGDAAHAIPGSGLKIGPDNSRLQALVEQLKRHNAATADETMKFKMALIVFPDSFDSVKEFRTIVQQVGGVREGWIPFLEDQVLRTGADGASVEVQ